jgi:hypothetical protein
MGKPTEKLTPNPDHFRRVTSASNVAPGRPASPRSVASGSVASACCVSSSNAPSVGAEQSVQPHGIGADQGKGRRNVAAAALQRLDASQTLLAHQHGGLGSRL